MPTEIGFGFRAGCEADHAGAPIVAGEKDAALF